EWPGSGAARSSEFTRKLEAAQKKRDAYLTARRDEIQKDFAERFSRYLKAAYDLKMDARSTRLDERALADKLDARRLRGVTMLWRRHLDAAPVNDPVLAPWQAFASLPPEGFAARAEEVRHRLLSVDSKKDPRAKPVHPLVARVVL